ncbi:MAG: hypothetical protein ABSC38_07495, partial [Verrucomicrobiia bacterium]
MLLYKAVSLYCAERWVRCVTILSLVVLHPPLIAAQEQLSQAPVNPAFEQYQAVRQQSMARAVSAQGHPLG